MAFAIATLGSNFLDLSFFVTTSSLVPWSHPSTQFTYPKNIFIVHSCGLLSSNPDAELSTLPFLLPYCPVANADWTASRCIEHDCNRAE